MAFLQDLKVKKVSFVNRAANKRTFLLLKSDDQVQEKEQEHEEESTAMKDEIRKSVRLLLKTGTSDEKIVETLKAEYKLDEKELAEVKASVEFARALASDETTEKAKKPFPPKPTDEEDDEEDDAKKKPAKKSFATSDDLDAVRKENKELRETLEKSAETQRKNEITVWLSENCPYLPADASKLVDDIYKMEKVDPEAAQRHRESLKQSSDMVKSSAIFVEKGSSFDSHPVPTGEILMKKVLEAKEEVRKGDGKMKESDAIINAIKSVPGAFSKYRQEHIRRSRLLG